MEENNKNVLEQASEKVLADLSAILEKKDPQQLNDYLSSLISKEDENSDRLAFILSATKTSNRTEEIFGPDQRLLGCLLSLIEGQDSFKGHYELTEEIIKKTSNNIITSPIAIRNFAEASRLPDFLYFTDLRYHAQSNTDKNGNLQSEEGQEDLKEFVIFLNTHLDELDKAIAQEQLKGVFFYTGILFHAIQDLACHQGMTNPEHSDLNDKRKSPDCDPERGYFSFLVNKDFAEKLIWPRLEKIQSQINLVGSYFWLTRFTPISIAEFIQGLIAFKFKRNRVIEFGSKNSARWFYWESSDYDDLALEEIKEKIFNNIAGYES